MAVVPFDKTITINSKTSAENAGVWKGSMADDKKKADKGGDDSGKGKDVKGFFRSISAKIKELFGVDVDLNQVLSTLNPEIKESARKAARAAKEFIPGTSFFRSKLAERGYGWITSTVEKFDKGGGLEPVFEKLSDFLETFVNEFCSEGDGGTADLKSLNPKLAQAAATFKEKFKEKVGEKFLLGRAPELISATHATDMKPVVEQLKEEAYGLNDVVEAFTHGRPKTPEPKEPKVPFRERFDTAVKAVDASIGKLNAELAPQVARLKAETERLRTERATRTTHPSKGFIAKILNAPWKLLAKLWQ